jgi:hypothetical protein
MKTTPEDSQPAALVTFARAMGRSRIGQCFGAIVVALVSLGLASFLWHHQDVAARLLALFVMAYGSQKAWEFLPVSTRLRQAFESRKVLRDLLGIGSLMLVFHYWPAGSWLGWVDLLGTLAGVGVGCSVIYLFRAGLRPSQVPPESSAQC